MILTASTARIASRGLEGVSLMRVAAIYDIHGNLPALEAVLQEIRQAEIDHVVVGGDVLPGPMNRIGPSSAGRQSSSILNTSGCYQLGREHFASKLTGSAWCCFATRRRETRMNASLD